MRIGLIRNRYTPYGGAEVFLGRFMEELLKRGHTLEVFANSWEERSGIKVHKIKTGGSSFLKPYMFARNAAKAVDRARPDIVISFERTYCQDIYRAGDGCHREWLIQRKKTVSFFKRVLISLSPFHMMMLSLEKKLFSSPRLKAVVANSARVKEEIIRHYGLPGEKIYVIYNGINQGVFGAKEDKRAEIRKDLNIKKDSVLLLFVGSGFERKGLIYLIRALGLLKEKGDVRLLVIGKGNTSKYSDEAKRLGVSDRVIFKGPVKGAAEFYQAGDIFVLPSIYEPFSNACLEALSSGLPVVTSRANGVSEILTDGVDGAIVEDPTEPGEIAKKITPLLDKGRRAFASKAARSTALKYPIERNVEDFLKLIEKMKKDKP